MCIVYNAVIAPMFQPNYLAPASWRKIMSHSKFSILLFGFMTILVVIISSVAERSPEVEAFDEPLALPVSKSGEQITSSAQAIGSIVINEVMFHPEPGQYDWVELKNIGTAAVSINNYGLTDEDGNWYVFPEDVPMVPAGAFVVIVFDGLDSPNDELDFNDNVVTLHSQPGLIDIFEDDTDQVAFYDGKLTETFLPIVLNNTSSNKSYQSQMDASASNTIANDPVQILDFVAWGAAPGSDAAAAIAAGIWVKDWAISLDRSTGFGIEGVDFVFPGEPIGLIPNTLPSDPAGWRYYLSHEASLGAENPFPSVAWSNTMPGTILRGDIFSIAWETIIGAEGYRFQLSETPDFSTTLVDTVVTSSSFSPETIIPTGQYYWRVQVIFQDGDSVWSSSMMVESWVPPATPASVTALTAVTTLLDAQGNEIVWQLQHKDTQMLILDYTKDGAECGPGRWDSAHGTATDPCERDVKEITPTLATKLDKNYCVRAALSMFVSYYGGELSQDRLSYYMYEELLPAGNGNKGVPEYDFYRKDQNRLWTTGSELKAAADWALNGPEVIGYSAPTFDQIKTWIDEGRPIIAQVKSPIGAGDSLVDHVLLITGYEIREEAPNNWLYWLDPYEPPPPLSPQGKPVAFRSGWAETTGMPLHVWVGPAGPDAAPNVLSDEDEDNDNVPDTVDDSDLDGIVDFDERHRFPGLIYTNPDSDNDSVVDKYDVREYVFDNNGNYSWRDPDNDGDGLRKEADPDNDNGGAFDGCEDSNQNGKYEQTFAETNNFASSDDTPEKCNVTGEWTGFLVQPDRIFSFEVSLSQQGSSIVGTSTIRRIDGYYAIMNLQGSVSDDIVHIEETEIIESTSSSGWRWCLKIMDLSLKEEYSALVLEGEWHDPGCNAGTLKLQRSINPSISVNGSWEGLLTQPGMSFPFELALIQQSAKLNGTSTIVSGSSYATMELVGFVAGGSLVIQETKIIDQSSGGLNWCIKTIQLTYNEDGTLEEMDGTWKDPGCNSGTVTLQR